MDDDTQNQWTPPDPPRDPAATQPPRQPNPTPPPPMGPPPAAPPQWTQKPPPPPGVPYQTPGSPGPGWWLAADGNWYPPQPVYGPAPTNNGMAIASLVLGIIWIYWIGSVLALIFGYIARRQIDESRGTQTGRSMATAGIVLGWIGVGILSAIILLAVIGAAAGT